MTQINPNEQVVSEDSYPLSPMQAGMLFHHLYSPGSGVYVGQVTAGLSGNLDPVALKCAWEQVIRRHSVLRTFIVWEDADRPMQHVCRRASLPWDEFDWRHYPSADRESRLEAYLQQDRSRGFDLSQPPLIRLALFRTADNEFILVWTRHHIIIDGWSASIVLKELFALYHAVTHNLPPALPEPPEYRRYIDWLQNRDIPQAEAFWRRKLKGYERPTTLGIDRQIGISTSAPEKYTDRHLALDETSTAELHAFARRHRLTLNTIVQGAWALILNRYSGEDDVVFGAVVSGRPAELEGIESIVGLFVNTLPTRIYLAPESKLVSWLNELQVQQAEARLYDYTPLVRIHGCSNVPRGEGLFESILIFENYQFGNSPRSGDETELTVNYLRIKEQANYPVTIVASPDRNLSLSVWYDGRRFSEGPMIRLLGHLRTLLQSFIVNPQKRIAELSFLTTAEAQQVITVWNQTERNYSKSQCVGELFEVQAGSYPDAVAIEDKDFYLSYGEANSRADQLAGYLRSFGVGPETLVGICLSRSLDWIISLLAVVKSGGAMVSLDPAYPSERLAFMIKDAQVPILLTQRHLLPIFTDNQTNIICVDSQWDVISFEARGSLPPMQPSVAADNSAYVVYTSGSTGRPKAVVTDHGSLLNLVFWHQRTLQVSRFDQATQVARMGFDAAMWELWPYLTKGATVHLLDEETALDRRKLSDWIVSKQITLGFLPPILAESILYETWPENLAFRILLTGSDKAVRHPSDSTPFKYINVYGPTEATVIVTWAIVPAESPFGTLPLIGRPLDNTQIYLLDNRMKPVPIGVPGELYIGGVNLARGYLNRSELTAEKFLPNPFSLQPGNRLYGTGDLARLHSDGNLEFIGRIDHQVKLRGFRIELGEIEAVIAQHPLVTSVVVVLRADTPEEKRLVAYLVVRSENASLIDELRELIRMKLPEYMVPSAFVVLDQLPLTPNSKVDRRALPPPDITTGHRSAKYLAPRNALERQLVRIWEDVLGTSPIGVTDNFFDLGGHSILAVRLAMQIQKQLGHSLPLSTLFENGDIARLAARLERKIEPSYWSPLVPIQPKGRKIPFFCVHPIGGQVFGYYDLARNLGPEQPFYGLQAPGPADIGSIHTTIENMSAEYIDAIRSIQPYGPYLIGGLSFGGLVAYEMAVQLRKRNLQVALVALLDSWSPLIFQKLPHQYDDAMLLSLIARTVARSNRKTLLLQPNELRKFDSERQLMLFLEEVRAAGLLGYDFPIDVGVSYVKRFLEGYRARLAAVRNYLPRTYPGPLVLFRAAEEDPISVQDLENAGWDPTEPTYGWSSMATEPVKVHFVPGTHETIGQEPDVRILAELLADSITCAVS